MVFFQDLKDTYKIKALCRNLGFPEKKTLVYVAINKQTQGGTLGPNALRRPSNLEAILGPFRYFMKADEIEHFKKLYTDPAFRDEVYKEYIHYIRDRFQRYTLRDVIRAYAKHR